MIGIGALAIDVSQWLWEQRNLQSAADAGAVSGAMELAYTGPSQAERRARIDTERNDIGAEAVVTVETPPSFGAFAGDAAALAVLIDKPMPLYLARVVGLESVTVSVRSAARFDNAGGQCVLGLDESIEGAVEVDGNGSVTMDCGVAANSSDPAAINMDSGSARMSVTAVTTPGGVNNRWDGLTASEGMTTGAAPIDDPYDEVEISERGKDETLCDETNFRLNNNADVDLLPGSYCGGMSLKGTVDLASGTYYIKGGELQINAGATVRGTDVTLVLTTDGSDYASIKINGGADVELSAPTDETERYAGLVIMQDPDAPACTGGNCNRINGGANMNLQGAIYIPNQSIDFTGNSNITNDPDHGCLQIVARQVIFTGSSALTNADCEDAGVKDIGTLLVNLVE
jgi:hypothetical protein